MEGHPEEPGPPGAVKPGNPATFLQQGTGEDPWTRLRIPGDESIPFFIQISE